MTTNDEPKHKTPELAVSLPDSFRQADRQTTFTFSLPLKNSLYTPVHLSGATCRATELRRRMAATYQNSTHQFGSIGATVSSDTASSVRTATWTGTGRTTTSGVEPASLRTKLGRTSTRNTGMSTTSARIEPCPGRLSSSSRAVGCGQSKPRLEEIE